jgi:hypothetical protein
MMKRACQFALLLLAALPLSAQAVIVAGPQGRNTGEPGGDLAGSGWQYQGNFGIYLGTPIAPQYFITAKHIGGVVGDKFTYREIEYTTTAFHDSPDADLRIWQVDESFPDHAALYSGADESGKTLILFGRGVKRGEEVILDRRRKGWRWAERDGELSWGLNTVIGITTGGPAIGDVLVIPFTGRAGAHEAALSAFDSGGGAFIRHAGQWQLAGINHGAEGAAGYKIKPEDPTSFMASLFDQAGLLVGQGAEFVPAPPRGGASYVTRIASNLKWIQSVIQPAPEQPAAPTRQRSLRPSPDFSCYSELDGLYCSPTHFIKGRRTCLRQPC